MTEEQQLLSDCTHYWMINRPNGPTSEGTCKLCGERAEFRNSITGSGWDRESAHNRRTKPGTA